MAQVVFAQSPGDCIIDRPDQIEKTVGLIVAAGRGRRMGESLPKQFLTLGDRAVLAHTVSAFLSADVIDHVAVVIHPDDRDLYQTSVAGIADPRLGPPLEGGDTRAQSVRRGLEALVAEAPTRVLIHDAARPFVSAHLVARVCAALEDSAGAFAAIPVVDALWSSLDGHAGQPVPRDGLWRAQTPQGFRFNDILEAHKTCSFEAADDVAVAQAAGLSVRIVEGLEANFKITTPEDFARAEKRCAKIR